MTWLDLSTLRYLMPLTVMSERLPGTAASLSGLTVTSHQETLPWQHRLIFVMLWTHRQKIIPVLPVRFWHGTASSSQYARSAIGELNRVISYCWSLLQRVRNVYTGTGAGRSTRRRFQDATLAWQFCQSYSSNFDQPVKM